MNIDSAHLELRLPVFGELSIASFFKGNVLEPDAMTTRNADLASKLEPRTWLETRTWLVD